MTIQKELWQGVASIIYGTEEPLNKVTNVMQYLSDNNVVIKEEKLIGTLHGCNYYEDAIEPLLEV